jgi:two-component system chemotaxis response regulator CheY
MDILLVDDSKVMRSMVQRAIRSAGYRSLTVEEAENGVSALAKLSVSKPRLIISDWNMPEMNGIELLKQVRAKDKKLPFGFITSESSQEIRAMAQDNGADFILAKPFTVEDVQDALDDVLGS